jgi:hypothetical protein
MTGLELFNKCIQMVNTCQNDKQLKAALKYFELALPRITQRGYEAYDCLFWFYYKKQEQKIFEFD